MCGVSCGGFLYFRQNALYLSAYDKNKYYNMVKRLFLMMAAALAVAGTASGAKRPFSSKLKKADVVEVCNAVADWQIENFEYDKRSDLHVLGWANGVLYKGLTVWAKESGQPQYYDFLVDIGRANGWRLLDLPRRWYFADDLCIGQMYVDLYKAKGDRKMIDTLQARILSIAHNPSSAPVSKRDSRGQFDRWSWCDALFMAPPIFAAMYDITGDKAVLDYLDSEFRACVDTLFDYDYNLFYRDDRKKPLREPNGAKQFWGRGNGWAIGGIVNTIENLPEGNPSREYYIELFKKLAAGIVATQQADGSWHASLLDPESYPVPENSASGLICYGLAWGVRNGYLDAKTYRKPILKAWKSLVSHVQADGKLGYVQPIGEAPKNITADSHEVYGPGAFLLAGSEIYKMAK